MTENTKISIETMRTLLIEIFDQMRQAYGDTIEVESEYFWSIPLDVKFDNYDEPRELTMGQVSESYRSLAKIANSSDIDRLPYLLKWFAEVFEAIAHDKPTWR